VAISEIYETEAWGVENQAFFLNVALLCTTTLSPNDVLRQIHSIESKMGRIRKEKWGPRLIDIDIIFYGEEIIKNPNLIIPHPQLTNRNFVLKGAKIILEQFADNPFLPLFYQEPERYAFSVELFFMTERYKQLQEDLQTPDLFSEYIFSDFFFMKSLLFAPSIPT